MSRYVEIGYPIHEEMPVHPALPKVGLEPRERLDKGDDWNGSVLSIYLHAGTHVDAPWHHLNDGRGIDQIPIEDFIYENPVMLDVPLEAGEFVSVDILKDAPELQNADLIIFNTGHWRYRDSDIEKYSGDFPAVSPEAAEYLRTQMPNVKAVAIDTLSIENLNDAKDNGYFVHHAFLDHKKYDEPTMLIYEDINPEPLIGKTLKSAFTAPLRITGHDASIVNIVVDVED